MHHDTHVTRLYRRDGDEFAAAELIEGATSAATFGYGLNVCDLNGDGYEDLLVAHNNRVTTAGLPRVLLTPADTSS